MKYHRARESKKKHKVIRLLTLIGYFADNFWRLNYKVFLTKPTRKDMLVFKRGIHVVPKLPNSMALLQNGVPKILSSSGFKTVWFDYQRYLCDKLTLATAGQSLESYYPFHILLKTAGNPLQSNIFNLASSIHNNHLFVENILPSAIESGTTDSNAVVKTEPSRLFLSRIQDSFNGSDWQVVKEEMIYRAENEVLGQGWLFLVENSEKKLFILTSNNNGCLLYTSRCV